MDSLATPSELRKPRWALKPIARFAGVFNGPFAFEWVFLGSLFVLALSIALTSTHGHSFIEFSEITGALKSISPNYLREPQETHLNGAK